MVGLPESWVEFWAVAKGGKVNLGFFSCTFFHPDAIEYFDPILKPSFCRFLFQDSQDVFQ